MTCCVLNITQKRLQRHLSSLPLGTLRKAQQTLTQSKEDEGETTSDEESAPEEESSRFDTKDIKEKREIAKRANKHAPMEMSSKRPVPRKKANIEESKPVPRDPRFLHSSGTFDSTRFRSQYGFLSEMHQSELGTLKENLKRARKLLVTSPRILRPEREGEVQRLERAVKRAESTVNKDKKEQTEENALKKVRQEEKEKRIAGKGAWYMKDADKRKLFTRAKYDALAEAGGRSAVRKAIEKKQRKVDQKEKKKRPFSPGESRGPNGKRPSLSNNQSRGGRPSKRQRMS
ncbi:hypothetical protein BDY19DRAFT_914872 [Irpex rosettiformis]|uniref:Uncharacterized protein n=1 Tax=Irpex rosettiformis TaxID=378272 RepID=A0ACB8UKD6_9APHY|nr:hypothetical protein BDY19DRAFT_914872 [Irpex rosettiformis]